MTAGWRLEGSGHTPVWHELLSPGLPAVSQNLMGHCPLDQSMVARMGWIVWHFWELVSSAQAT